MVREVCRSGDRALGMSEWPASRRAGATPATDATRQSADAGRAACIDAHDVVATCWKATPLQRRRDAANGAPVFWQ
jgi:hypothetical protein